MNLGNSCVYSLPAFKVFRVKLFFFFFYFSLHTENPFWCRCASFLSSVVTVFWIKFRIFLVCLWPYFLIADDIANFEVSFCISEASFLVPMKNILANIDAK